MTAKCKTSKRKPAKKPTKKPVRRRARPLTAPELVFPVGSFPPPPAKRTLWQRVFDFFEGKP